MRPLDVARLRAYRVPDARERYDARDAILYALGVGAGLEPTVDELSLVFERELRALPTLALVLGTPGFWPMDPRTGIDWPRVLHGEQTLRLHRPLAPGGEVVGATTITDIADKGPGGAALVRARRTLEAPGGEPIAEMEEVWVLRGAGGFGGTRALPGPLAPPLPDRAPDAGVTLPTSSQQATLYRLSGDRNPLHVEPEAARVAGFDRPLLHGLSAMGLAARALIRLHCDGDPERLSMLAARFTAPVYPGDAVAVETWRDGDALSFRAKVGAATVMTGRGAIGF